MTSAYALWHAELKQPVPEEDRHNRTNDPNLICGFWRITAARTKISYPCAIWPQDGSSGNAIFFKIGVGAKDGESLFDTVSSPERVDQFAQSTWLKCIAIPDSIYHAAMNTGKWPDGQSARQWSEAEKLDIVPDTPAAAGGNNPDGADAFHEQIVTKIEAEIEAVRTTPFPLKSLDAANELAGHVETLRGLGKMGKAKFEEEKAPWRKGGDAVDSKWRVIKEASDVVKTAVDLIQAFRDAEEARLRREAAAVEAAERERIAAEARKQSEQAGQQVDEAEVAAIVEERIAAAPQPVVDAPRVGTAHGRGISKAKRPYGRITDKAAFVAALDGQADFDAWLQDKADKLARAGTALKGMEIDHK